MSSLFTSLNIAVYKRASIFKERQSFFDLLQQIQVFPSFFTSFQQSPFNGTAFVWYYLLFFLRIC
nr:MAG TPA: hypothetical protein [Caudoviricetes sp.]